MPNGSDVDPGNFTGVSKFTDVPAWAEGYVNYCAATGVVVGVGEGKFNPNATVSTVEAATMLLKALGYFTEEDQLQADWKTVVNHPGPVRQAGPEGRRGPDPRQRG